MTIKDLLQILKNFDDGGLIKVDKDAGGIVCNKSSNVKHYESDDKIKKILNILGNAPPLKLLYDLLMLYMQKRKDAENELIDKLIQQDTQSLTLSDGTKIDLDISYYVSIKDTDAYFEWLRSEGYGDCIKSLIELDSANSEIACKTLQKMGITSFKKDTIHWMTNRKIITDKLHNGEELPGEDVLTVGEIKKIKIT
jgi:hypothetical protein